MAFKNRGGGSVYFNLLINRNSFAVFSPVRTRTILFEWNNWSINSLVKQLNGCYVQLKMLMTMNLARPFRPFVL